MVIRHRVLWVILTLLVVSLGLFLTTKMSINESQKVDMKAFDAILEYEDSFYKEMQFLVASREWYGILDLMDTYENSPSDILGTISDYSRSEYREELSEERLSGISRGSFLCDYYNQAGKFVELDNCYPEKSEYRNLDYASSVLSVKITSEAPHTVDSMNITVHYESGKTSELEMKRTSYREMNGGRYVTGFVYDLSKNEIFKNIKDNPKVGGISIRNIDSDLIDFRPILVSDENIQSPLLPNSCEIGFSICSGDGGGDGWYKKPYLPPLGGGSQTPISPKNKDAQREFYDYYLGICTETSLRYHKGLSLNSMAGSSGSIFYGNSPEEVEELKNVARIKFEGLVINRPYLQNREWAEGLKDYECR